MSTLQTKMLLLVGLGVMALLPGAKAGEWDQKTVFTFSGPVEIPGQILPAGTYVFKLHNSDSNRHIVQVFNKDENHVFGTFLAIPDYRLHPSSKPIINFHERAAKAPAYFFRSLLESSGARECRTRPTGGGVKQVYTANRSDE